MIRYKPKISVVGLLSGLVLGVSLLALAHQNGSVYPTLNLTIGSAVGGLLLCGILLPSLTRFAKVRKVNARLAARRH